jgi:hypothetical protein
MGSGKTLICLSLIVTTITHLTRTDDSDNESIISGDEVGLALDETPGGALGDLNDIPAWLKAFSGDGRPSLRSAALSGAIATDIKYPCLATIIVVPRTLIEQWKEEIERCVRPGMLTCYVAKEGVPLPVIEELKTHDVGYSLGFKFSLTQPDHSHR